MPTGSSQEDRIPAPCGSTHARCPGQCETSPDPVPDPDPDEGRADSTRSVHHLSSPSSHQSCLHTQDTPSPPAHQPTNAWRGPFPAQHVQVTRAVETCLRSLTGPGCHGVGCATRRLSMRAVTTDQRQIDRLAANACVCATRDDPRPSHHDCFITVRIHWLTLGLPGGPRGTEASPGDPRAP